MDKLFFKTDIFWLPNFIFGPDKHLKALSLDKSLDESHDQFFRMNFSVNLTLYTVTNKEILSYIHESYILFIYFENLGPCYWLFDLWIK